MFLRLVAWQWNEFLNGEVDEVFLVYTDFVNMARQTGRMQKLLPLELDAEKDALMVRPIAQEPTAAYIYEPAEREILDEIIPRFTALQVYQADFGVAGQRTCCPYGRHAECDR